MVEIGMISMRLGLDFDEAVKKREGILQSQGSGLRGRDADLRKKFFGVLLESVDEYFVPIIKELSRLGGRLFRGDHCHIATQILAAIVQKYFYRRIRNEYLTEQIADLRKKASRLQAVVDGNPDVARCEEVRLSIANEIARIEDEIRNVGGQDFMGLYSILSMLINNEPACPVPPDEVTKVKKVGRPRDGNFFELFVYLYLVLKKETHSADEQIFKWIVDLLSIMHVKKIKLESLKRYFFGRDRQLPFREAAAILTDELSK